jgi:hypothetical protein
MFARAETVAQRKQRAAIDAAAAKAGSDIKACNKKFAVTFDWKAYDALDWQKLGKDKYDFLQMEHSNLAELGVGFDKLCGDADYRAALAKIDSIVYVPTNNDKIRLKATVKGTSLLLENYSFGSTRRASDYEGAVKASL